jgi:hypothetical protein
MTNNIETIPSEQLGAVLGGCNICIGNCPQVTQTDNSQHTQTEPTKPVGPLPPGEST